MVVSLARITTYSSRTFIKFNPQCTHYDCTGFAPVYFISAIFKCGHSFRLYCGTVTELWAFGIVTLQAPGITEVWYSDSKELDESATYRSLNHECAPCCYWQRMVASFLLMQSLIRVIGPPWFLHFRRANFITIILRPVELLTAQFAMTANSFRIPIRTDRPASSRLMHR